MNIWEACLQLKNETRSFVMVTQVGVRGSAPQDPGTKIIVTREGLFFGTVGGGKVEFQAIKKAQTILESQHQLPPETVTWNLQRDIGMSCGGESSFLFEHFHETQWPIVIFGAGHVSQALTRVLNKLPCQITVIDSRSEWLEKLEGVKTILHPEPKELVLSLNPKSYFLCMTMGHSYDVPILVEIAKIAPDCPYVGVIGSDVKAIKIKKDLKELDVPESFLQKLKVPMGLPIGTNHPYEMAISISAQLLGARDSQSEAPQKWQK